MEVFKQLLTLFVWLIFCYLPTTAKAESDSYITPIAILPFTERGQGLGEYGRTISDLMFAELVVNEKMYLVDREDFAKLMDEAAFNLSGMVSPQQMIQVGQLTGAKIIITGTVLEVEDRLILIAKVIGTETSRVFGSKVTGNINDDLSSLVEELSKGVIEVIESKSTNLLATKSSRKDRIRAVSTLILGREKPSIEVTIKERHISQNTIDPAAETEMKLFFTELGFEVYEPSGGESRADVKIIGEGFTELATRHKSIRSVRARLEVRAVVKANQRLIAIERQNEVEIDLAEHIAGKMALQEAAAAIAERLIPKIVDAYNP